MTQKEKQLQLLLEDLCARLPHGVKVSILGGGAMELQACIHSSTIGWYFDIKDAPTDFGLDEIKPYLRPMSSMTEEEFKMVCSMNALTDTELRDRINFPNMFVKGYTIETFDLFNSRHFDYRGLIPMGLAIEAPEDMYKTE